MQKALEIARNERISSSTFSRYPVLLSSDFWLQSCDSLKTWIFGRKSGFRMPDLRKSLILCEINGAVQRKSEILASFFIYFFREAEKVSEKIIETLSTS